jgi:predicted SprT family Zn-dependent metalloprotease
MPLFPQLGPQYYEFCDRLFLFNRGSFFIMEIIGKLFGKWEVLDFSHKDEKSNKYYSCKCECGFVKIHRSSTLRAGDSLQCKKCRMASLNKTIDLIGKKFGLWTVLSKYKNDSRNEWLYLCRCDCGLERGISGSSLKSKNTTRCNRCRVKTHGMSSTSTFRIWTGILRRCLNKNFKNYKYYGGRGIKVCKRWLKFENFYKDMGERPLNLQIDRIDNDGHYEPGNCRWVTSRVNNLNKRPSKRGRL